MKNNTVHRQGNTKQLQYTHIKPNLVCERLYHGRQLHTNTHRFTVWRYSCKGLTMGKIMVPDQAQNHAVLSKESTKLTKTNPLQSHLGFEGLWRFVRSHLDRLLHHYRTGVYLLGDLVHRAAGSTLAGRDDRLMHLIRFITPPTRDSIVLFLIILLDHATQSESSFKI